MPCIDACSSVQLAAVDQVAAERAVGMAVLVGKADADALAVVELDLARALDLQEEELDRIGDPGDHRRAEVRAARVDLRARVKYGTRRRPVERGRAGAGCAAPG